MKVIVLGSGIVGVLSAYFLAKQGFKVEVIDQNSGTSRSCSFGNGGQLSYSHIETWAQSTSLFSLFKAGIMPNSYLTVKNFFDKELLDWFFKFYSNSFENKARQNSKNLFYLASHSREMMQEILNNESSINFSYKNNGTLHFFRKNSSFEKAINNVNFEHEIGCKSEILDKEQTLKKEPTLQKLYDDKNLVGSIFYKDDASGNSFRFASSLEKICKEKYGVTFTYNTKINNIFTNYKKITGINTSEGVLSADNYVYALGALGDKLLKGIKIDSEIYPLKGYSISVEVNEPDFKAPNMALTDIENKVVYSRLGNIFRVAGTVEASGINVFKNSKHVSFLKNNVRNTFSDFGDFSKIYSWYGFRPSRPNSTPLICKSLQYPNLFLNTGHGSLGWTLSASSGAILANLVLGKEDKKFSFLKKESR